MRYPNARHTRFRRAALAGWLSGLLLAGTPLCSGAASFELEGKPPSATAIEAVVEEDGTVWLTLTATASSAPAELTLSLSQFRDDRGSPIVVAFPRPNSTGGDRPNSTGGDPVTTRTLTLHGWTTLRLDASMAVLGRAYEGELGVTPKSGQPETFSLSLERRRPAVFQTVRPGAEEQSINVPADGMAPVQFDVNSDKFVGQEASFELGLFTNETDGSVAQVYFLETDKIPPVSLDRELVQRRLRFSLNASEIGFNDVYAGELAIKVGAHALAPIALKLTRRAGKRDAVLVVGQPLPVELVCVKEWECTPEPIEVEIYEDSGQRPIIGLSVATVAGEPGEGGLQPVRDLAVTFAGVGGTGDDATSARCPWAKKDAEMNAPKNDDEKQEVVDLWHVAAADRDNVDRRSLPPQSQGTLCVTFRRALSPGTYKVPLQVRALNAASVNPAKFLLTVNARHHVLWPLTVLVISVLLSYFLTKVIRTQLQRIGLGDRITAIEEIDWFRRDWSILPVVRMKALLAQVNKAIGYHRLAKFLYFPASLSNEVGRVEARQPHLGRLCTLLSYWDGSNDDKLVCNRAKKALRSVVAEFTAAPLRDDLDASVIAQLTNLEEWRDATKLLGHYWLGLKADILQLQSQVRLGHFAGHDFTQSREKLDASLAAVGDRDIIQRVEEALPAFQQTLGSAADATAGQAFKVAANAITRLPSGQLETIAGAFATIDTTLKEIDENGPLPALGAVAAARRDIASSALRKELPAFEGLHKMLDSDPALGADPQRAELMRGLQKLASWDPAGLTATLDTLEADLEASRRCDRQTVRELLSRLKPDDQPRDLTEAIRRDEAYARLKLIWGADTQSLQTEVLDMHRSGSQLDDLFKKVDKWAWQRLQKSARVESSANESTDEVGAFELIDFRVKADRETMDTYLFKHGLIYEWTLSYHPERRGWLAGLWRHIPGWRRGAGEPRTQSVTTNEPRMSYFIPQTARDVKASVKMHYDDDEPWSCESDKLFSVGKAEIFGLVAAFQRVELAALVIALVAAIGSATQSQQFQAALVGSLSAYLALFVWGFSADQIKNLLENIRSLTGAEE